MSNNIKTKKLFSFKRCPYAIRARMILKLCGIGYDLIEVDLKNKPKELIKASAKATVPVLILESNEVIDESIEIIKYALLKSPESSLNIHEKHNIKTAKDLISENDSYFKYYLDRYKYHIRYLENSKLFYRQKAEVFLTKLEAILANKNNIFLLGKNLKYLDIVIFPFVRQFCYVDEKWFKNDIKYQNLMKWLNTMEDKRNSIDK